jgi:3D (Asp-Asp-Asp) domain-containing protein
MKNLPFSLLLSLSLFFNTTTAFADTTCKSITVTASKENVTVSAAGCTLLGTAAYRIMVSEKDFNTTKASVNTDTFTISDAPIKDTGFTRQLPASKDTYHAGTGGFGGTGGSAGYTTTHLFKYASIIQLPNATDTNIANAILVKEEKIVAPVSFRPLVVSAEKADGSTDISGGIQTANDMGPYKAKVRLAVSTDSAFPDTGNKTSFYIKLPPLDDTGAFSFSPKDLYADKNPGEVTYIKQFYYDPYTGQAVWDTKYSAPNKIFGNDVAAETDDLEKHSYTLLSTLGEDDPKKQIIFYDPGSAICAARKSEGDSSALCDFSSVLNFVIKLMIGAAVVFLIISLMIDGFKYMLTDIAGVKSEAKKTIMDKGMGLLIALSSYVILRTINPTLVDNTISIEGVTITRLTLQESQERIADMLSGKVPSPAITTMKVGETKKIQITCYNTAIEADYSGSQINEVKDVKSQLIAKVRPGFFDINKPLRGLFIEGAGVLIDGRVVNVDNNSKVDPRYKVVNMPMGAWGVLSPMRSIAVDKRLIAPGSEVEMPYFKGRTVSYTDKDGSTKSFQHDGKFLAVDRGGMIQNQHIDIYAGFGNKTMKTSGCNNFAGSSDASGQKFLDIKIFRQGK